MNTDRGMNLKHYETQHAARKRLINVFAGAVSALQRDSVDIVRMALDRSVVCFVSYSPVQSQYETR